MTLRKIQRIEPSLFSREPLFNALSTSQPLTSHWLVWLLLTWFLVGCKQVEVTEGEYRLVEASSAQVLVAQSASVDSGSGTSGNVLTMEAKTTAPNEAQIWQVSAVAEHQYTLRSRSTGQVISVDASDAMVELQLVTPDYSDAQLFSFKEAYPGAAGLLALQNIHSGTVMSVDEGKLLQKTYRLGASQQWRLEALSWDQEDALAAYLQCPLENTDAINFMAKDNNFPGNGYHNPKNAGNQYTTIATQHRAAMRSLLSALASGDYAQAHTLATDPHQLNLLTCQFQDAKARTVLAFKSTHGRNPRAADINLLWRVEGANALVLESPHSGSDGGVSYASMRVFYHSSAQAMIMNEYDRHASSTRSGCSGNSGTYEISDVAHAPTSLFHFSHIQLSELFPRALFANLHGMGKSGNGISISNGLGYSFKAKSNSALKLFTQHFLQHARFQSGNKADFTACQLGTAFVHKSRVCGTTNIQGRYLNGSPKECTQRGNRDSDRFLHVEQGAYIRGSVVRQQALADVFDAVVSEWEQKRSW